LKAFETPVRKLHTSKQGRLPATQVNTRTDNEASDFGSTFVKKYCYCLRSEYGEMVACDNTRCERIWFHLAHTDLQELPSEEENWLCTLCRGWAAELDTDDDCWRCPKCGCEILDDDANYDEGKCPKRAPKACDMCKLEPGAPWQQSEYDSEISDSEEGGDESESDSDDETDSDDVEHDVDPEHAEMDYDEAESCGTGSEDGDEDNESMADDDETSACSTHLG
jgi:hypothetical protein